MQEVAIAVNLAVDVDDAGDVSLRPQQARRSLGGDAMVVTVGERVLGLSLLPVPSADGSAAAAEAAADGAASSKPVTADGADDGSTVGDDGAEQRDAGAKSGDDVAAEESELTTEAARDPALAAYLALQAREDGSGRAGSEDGSDEEGGTAAAAATRGVGVSLADHLQGMPAPEDGKHNTCGGCHSTAPRADTDCHPCCAQTLVRCHCPLCCTCMLGVALSTAFWVLVASTAVCQSRSRLHVMPLPLPLLPLVMTRVARVEVIARERRQQH